MAGPTPEFIVIVEDRLRFTQLIGDTVAKALPEKYVKVELTWAQATRYRPERLPATTCFVVAMNHQEALEVVPALWRRVGAVLVDTHDVEREWRGAPKPGEVFQPVYAGAEVATRLLDIPAPRPRVICYSAQLDNPLVRILLWQQTRNGGADAYYHAEALTDPVILRSALRAEEPEGQAPAPDGRDFTLLGVDLHAPIYEAMAGARKRQERWELIMGLKTYAEATDAARKWMQRQAAVLGSGQERRKGRGDSVVRLLRRAASGTSAPPSPPTSGTTAPPSPPTQDQPPT